MHVDVDTLEELNLLARDGTEHAKDSLVEMTESDVVNGTTRILLVNHHDLLDRIDRGPYEVVRFDITGKLSGTALLMFDEKSTDAVTTALVPEETDGSMAQASLLEMANIMIGGFTTHWGNYFNTGLNMTSPTVLADPDTESLQLDPTGAKTNSTLVFQSGIHWRGSDAHITIYLAPDQQSLDTVLASSEESNSTEAESTATGATADGSEPDSAQPTETGLDDGQDEPSFDENPFDSGGNQVTLLPLQKLSVFSDLAKEGTEEATNQLTMMAGTDARMEITGLTFTPVEDISNQFENGNYVGTAFELDGLPSGNLIIVFELDSGKAIGDQMLPMEPDEDGFTNHHENAIKELCNIMTSGFIDGWANVLETSIVHTPPDFLSDFDMRFVQLVTEQVGAFQTHMFTIQSTITTDDGASCEFIVMPDETELADALDSLTFDRVEKTQADPSDLF